MTNTSNFTTPPTAFKTSKSTAIFLLSELLDSIQEQLEPSQARTLQNLFQYVSDPNQSEFALPGLESSDSLETASLVTKFLKFYLEFNHLAERFHRIYETRESHLVPNLLDDFKKNISKVSPEDFKIEFEKINIDLVFTAHPTEIYERKVLKKYMKLMYNLQETQSSKGHSLTQLSKDRKALMLSLWLSPNRREKRPSPKDEAKLAQMIYQYSLWNGLSGFKRLFHNFLKDLDLPLDVQKNNFHFYSWMGGDRDGNPYVTAKLTEEIILSFFKKSLNLYYRELKRLKEDLCFELEYKGKAYSPEKVVEICKRSVAKVLKSDMDFELLKVSEESILKSLEELYQVLLDCKLKFLADQRLLNTLDRLKAFGLGGMAWDIRQESTYHDELCDELFADHLNRSYSKLSDSEKLQWLKKNKSQLKSWILNLKTSKLSLEANDFIETLKLIAKYDKKVFKYYIISMTRSASDLVLIQYLLESFGAQTQVVPLFETLEDLENSASIMHTYYEILGFKADKDPTYQKHQHLIMLGYSDSAKTGSRLASVWNLYLAQKQLVEVSEKFNVDCQFFHGRGGSVGRGGGPVPAAIKSCPIEATKNGFRVTVQGEVIFDRFGFPQVAIQSLMTYMVGLLNYKFSKRKDPKALKDLESIFAKISEDSKEKYRQLLNSKNFYDYFEATTPVNLMGQLNIGSRPTKRKASAQKSYRAIPWIFGWTQNRSLLPTWYGAGFALEKAIEKHGLETIQKTYKDFYLFQSALDLIYICILKTDFKTFESYHKELGAKIEGSEAIFTNIQNEYETLKTCLNQIVDIEKAANVDQEEKLQGRLEVLNWLNDYQKALLKKQNSKEDLSDEEMELLVLSIQALASGLGNTG